MDSMPLGSIDIGSMLERDGSIDLNVAVLNNAASFRSCRVAVEGPMISSMMIDTISARVYRYVIENHDRFELEARKTRFSLERLRSVHGA